MQTTVQIIRNVLANWGSYFVSTVIGFFMMPFVIHHLGNERYGIWVLILSLTGYLGLLDLGVSGSVVKYVAEVRAKKDYKRLNQLSSSGFCIYSAVGLLALLFTPLIAFHFSSYFNIPPHYLSTAKYMVLLTEFNIALSFPVGF